MSVIKKTGFRTPYKSFSFREMLHPILNRNSVLTMSSDVYESGGIVYIPPFSFNQNGLIVEVTDVRSINKPPTLIAPYYLVVSAPTTQDVDDLIFSFAQAPKDVQSSECILAEYDGVEWRQLPYLNLDERIKAVEQDRLDAQWDGPIQGLKTILNLGSLENSPGLIIDRQGYKARLDGTAIFALASDDVEPTYSRVDKILYRRSKDEYNRIGTRKYLTGGTYGVVGVQPPLSVASSATRHECVRVSVDNNNYVLLAYAEGYGSNIVLKLAVLDEDRQTYINIPTTLIGITPTETKFDFAVNPGTGDCYFVYIQNNSVKFVRTASNGMVLTGPITIETHVQACTNPRIQFDATGKLLVYYSVLLGPSNYQLFFTSVTTLGLTITGQKRIVNTATNVINHDFYVTNDLYVHLVYEEKTTGRIYYEIYDDIGDAISTGPLLLSQNVVSTSYGVNSDNASEPKIRVSDTNDVFVVFKQLISGMYKLCFWKNTGAAQAPDLLTIGENIGPWDFFLSSITNDILIYYNDLSVATCFRILIDGLNPYTVLQSDGYLANAQFISALKDKTGSGFSAISDVDPGTYTNAGTPQTVEDIGPGVLVGSQGTVSLGLNDVSFQTVGLTHTPAIGERVTITGAVIPANNTSRIVTSVNAYNYNGTNDLTVVSLDSNLFGSESPAVGVSGQFATPDGMALSTVKTTTELDASRALSEIVLDTDILLTRIVSPGTLILNYIQNPAFTGGPIPSSDQLFVYGQTPVDWEQTLASNLTLGSSLYIFDILNNFTYTAAAGSYAMSEGMALVVFLDGVTANVTPQVIFPPFIPWANNPQILGVIKNGQFVPGLLEVGGGETLSSGEAIVIGNDLPTETRSRLGLTGDDSFEAYTNTHRIGANDNYATALSKLSKAAQDHDQDRNVKLLDGGEWSVAGTVLTWSAAAYVEVPTCAKDRNTIPAGNVNLGVDEVAYVTINRAAGAAANLTVSTALISTFTITADTVIIARKTADGFIVGTHSFKLLDGESKSLDAGTSWQTFTAVGLTGAIDEGPLKIKAITGSKRIRVTPINNVLHDGTTFGDEFSGLSAVFAGCQIDLETGNYYGYGDGTIAGSGPLLGSVFTPVAFTSPNLFRWYSVQLTVDTVPGDGTILLKPMVLNGNDGASAVLATRAVYSGKKIGQTVVEAPGSGSTINAIIQANVVQLSGGTGSGGGGGLTANLIDYVTTALPATTATPIDGETIVSGHTVLFTKAPITGYYSASVVGINITWTSLPVFNGSSTPSLGDQISIKAGTNYNNTVWHYGGRGWKPLDSSDAELEPTGWVDASEVTLSFNDLNRTLSITPTGTKFDTYQRGKPYRHSGVHTRQIADTEGMHFIYFDDGALYETTTFTEDIIKRYVFVASVYWDQANQTAILFGYELHGIEMDGVTHRYLHVTVGTRYSAGLGASNFTTAGTGAVNSDAQLDLSGGTIHDEDITIDIIDDPAPAAKFEQILSGPAMIPVYYRSGAGGDWRKHTTTAYPIHFGTARAVYNNPAGPWTTPDATVNGNYVAMWLFATNNINEPIIAVMGQREDTSLSDAQANNTYESLLIGTLPILEMKVLYRLIFQTDAAYTNAVKSALRDVRDLRRAVDTSLGSYIASDHGLLSGLNDPDHPASAIFTGATAGTPPTYAGGLSASDTRVSEALDTLDKTLGQMRVKKHATLSTRVTIADSIQTLNDGTSMVQSLKDLLITFSGAQIDFQSGNIYAANGVTIIGTFTPATIANTFWRWYAVYLTINGLANSQNEYDLTINVVPALTDGASKAAAVSASFGRKTALKLGQVAIQGAGGSNISAIAQADIKQLGTGGGGGGGGDEYTEQALINNQVTPVDVDDFLIPPSESKTFQAKYSIIRRRSSGGPEYLQTGRFSGLYSALTTDWTLLGFTSEGLDAGVSFSMTPAGQLKYTSNDLSGGGTFSESALRWTVTRL